jgi:hypothetical protein
MHGRKRRLGGGGGVRGAGVQKLFDGQVGLIDPVRARTGIGWRDDESGRGSSRRHFVSNDHFILLGSDGRPGRTPCGPKLIPCHFFSGTRNASPIHGRSAGSAAGITARHDAGLILSPVPEYSATAG